jgi:uncharacterized MAPEG superfamily protein
MHRLVCVFYIPILETFQFFAALVLVAHVINHHSGLTIRGVHLYFSARLGYLLAAAAGGRCFPFLFWLLECNSEPEETYSDLCFARSIVTA